MVALFSSFLSFAFLLWDSCLALYGFKDLDLVREGFCICSEPGPGSFFVWPCDDRRHYGMDPSLRVDSSVVS
jgi:hypothetical protein